MLRTESPSPEHVELDRYAPAALLQALVDDQLGAVRAVQAALPQLEAALAALQPRIEAGGRLIYVGAGTSGRLGHWRCWPADARRWSNRWKAPKTTRSRAPSTCAWPRLVPTTWCC
jgi:hypothetical protein